MARGRMISKSLSTSQKYAQLSKLGGRLSEFCQAIFPLLVAHTDDFGRLAGDVFTVKHAIVPASPRKEKDVEAALALLHEVGLILWYDVSGRKYIQIQGFDVHQAGLHKRTRSAFPDPSGNFPESPSELKRTEQKGTEAKRTEPPPSAARPRLAPLHDTSHRKHAHCGRVCLPASLFSEFVRRRNHDGADMEIRDWAQDIEREWGPGGRRTGEEPGDPWAFWKSRYSEQSPAAKPARGPDWLQKARAAQ